MNLPSEPEKGSHGKKADDQPQDGTQPRVTDGNSAGSSDGGWIERLAQRSTGLPADDRPNVRMEPKGDTSLWRVAGLGIQFAATVAMFAWMGNALDKRMGWSPWGLVSLCLLAVIGNMYLLIKETMQQDGPTKKSGVKNVSHHAEKRSPPPGRGGPGG